MASDNLIIYGHHISGNRMFGALEDYKSKSFYEEHKTIHFDTLTQQGEYEIVAVFKTVAYSSEGFRYYDLSVRKVKKNLTPMWKHAGSLPYTIRA